MAAKGPIMHTNRRLKWKAGCQEERLSIHVLREFSGEEPAIMGAEVKADETAVGSPSRTAHQGAKFV